MGKEAGVELERSKIADDAQKSKMSQETIKSLDEIFKYRNLPSE
jgi:hypothetical protein